MKKIKKPKKYSSKKRAIYFTFTFATVFLLLTLRLTYIMIYKSSEYKSKAQEQWSSQVSVDAHRGDITDRNGSLLATSIDVYRVDLDLNAIETHLEENETTREEIAVQLAEASGLTVEEVTKKLNPVTEDGVLISNSTLITGIDKETADNIEALNIYGTVTSISAKRYYPNNNFLAHALGSVNSDNTGLNGIELEYDSDLKGIDGYKIAEVDGGLQELPFQTVKYTSPVDGKNIKLTIDENIQLIAENLAEEAYNQHKAKDVTILVMNPNNGEILAMANFPDFNPNTAYEDYELFAGNDDFEKLQNMFRNSATSDIFEPGSTFKNITMVAALEEGIVNESNTFNCNGSVKFGSTTIKCWNTSGHGTQTLPEILQNSCNVGFMKLGEMLGSETLNQYIEKFGFGQLTNIDLPGEAEGIVKSVSDISEMDLATISFGQTNTVNSVQILTAFNAIANGGSLIQPHIMKEISHEESNGTTVIDEIFEPTVQEGILSEETSKIMIDYLERTINQGQAIGSFMGKDRRVGAKTGTAQTVDIVNGGYSSDKYISSVLALYPVEDPQITVYIKVNEPSTGVYYGGQVATPILKSLLTELFNYMDSQIYQERYTEIEKIVVPEIRGESVEKAKKILEQYNLNIEIKQEGNKVTNMIPYAGALVEVGSTITVNSVEGTVDEEKIIMPNLKGKTLEEATQILNSLNLKFTTNGSGIVSDQDIIAGKFIEKGTKVSLDLVE
ncbi:MAG: stage V sporulation protein D [Clostridium sp.]|nr:stage V sporulation protein D [Clostridium sp.]